MSGFSHIELDEIIKRGAVDFIIKPLDLDVLLYKVRRALDPKSLE
jgi:FixJ family two-component response regulator